MVEGFNTIYSNLQYIYIYIVSKVYILQYIKYVKYSLVYINNIRTYLSRIFLIMAGGILSLSKVFSDSKNFMSLSIRVEGPQ